jgi:hypothetical protein
LTSNLLSAGEFSLPPQEREKRGAWRNMRSHQMSEEREKEFKKG